MNNRKIAVNKRSNTPYYAAAATFALITLIFIPHTIAGFIVTFLITAAVFFVTRHFAKDVTVYKDRPSLGVPELDEALSSLENASATFARVRPLMAESSPSGAGYLASTKASTDGMISNLTAHPEDLKIVRKFINVYLPMVIKMLINYEEMYHLGTKGDNVISSMNAIEGAMISIDDAFRRQLDAQFANDNLDVATDIEVLDVIMGKTSDINK